MRDVPDPRELEVFFVLARELHFGRTAERLLVSQSRVSQAIRALEVRVGARLFERSSRRVVLTTAGADLLDRAEPAYHRLVEAIASVHRSMATGLDGVLRIRIPNPSSGGDHLLRIVRRFREQNPACEVTLVTGGIRDDPLRQLRAGEVDLAALRLPLHQSDLTIGPVLSEESRVLLVAEDDPLAEREHIDYDDVGERRVSQNPAFPAEMMDAFIPPVTASGRTLNRVQNESIEQLMLRVALGEQVHPTVVSWLDHHPYAGVVAVPIRDLPVTQTALVWLRNSFDARVRAFVDVTENVLGAFPLG